MFWHNASSPIRISVLTNMNIGIIPRQLVENNQFFGKIVLRFRTFCKHYVNLSQQSLPQPTKNYFTLPENHHHDTIDWLLLKLVILMQSATHPQLLRKAQNPFDEWPIYGSLIECSSWPTVMEAVLKVALTAVLWPFTPRTSFETGF